MHSPYDKAADAVIELLRKGEPLPTRRQLSRVIGDAIEAAKDHNLGARRRILGNMQDHVRDSMNLGF